ncbi:MAG: pilus assembly protein N-terminal domain-containing protein [Planctomycetaceae bacterium]
MLAELNGLKDGLLKSLARRLHCKPTSLFASALAGCSLFASGFAQQYQQQSQPAGGWNQPASAWNAPTGSGMPSGNSGVPVHSAQYSFEKPPLTGRIDAVHSPNVDRMLQPQYKLELEKRHSQLILTNKNVRRIAVTDSTVVNYVQYSPTELSVVGLELGKTDLTLWFENEDTPAIYEATVVRDESLEEQRTIDFGRLERRMTDLFPNSRVYLIPIGNQVIVQGQAYDSEEAQHILQIVRSEVARTWGRFNDDDGTGNSNFTLASGGGTGGAGNGAATQLLNQGFRDIVVNRLTVPGEYNVNLRVVVAEVNRSELRNMGMDWNVLFNQARHSVSGSLGGVPATLGGIFENGEIEVFLKWLTSNGTVTLLAEPRLTTLSGHPASILGGGEFAVPTTIGLGGGQTTTFRGFGTSMIVTPTVIDRDLIRLQVVPEFSSINQNNTVNGIPGTNVKRVQTTVELREGQTFAIGGLISRQTLTEVSRIPLLGDIPYVGSKLFHSKTASEIETELLVLVSPEIVRPMEPDEVPPLPNYYVTHPNDYDLYHYGRTEGNPDTNVYQIPPYGTGATYGTPQGYSLYNPGATHGGFGGGFGAGNGGMMLSPGPQPECSLPPAQGSYGMGYGNSFMSPGVGQSMPSAPVQNYQAPPVQHFSAPPSPNYSAPPVQNFQPTPMPQPSGAPPLPPIPNNYQSQYNSMTPASVEQQPSLRTRMASMFRKEDSTQGTSVKNTSWSK